MEQLSLFVEENTLYNTAVRQLLDLDFRGCRDSLEHYRRLFSWDGDLQKMMAINEFWLERIGDTHGEAFGSSEVEKAYGLWLEFEEAFGPPWSDGGVEQRLQREYFRRLSDRLDQGGDGVAPRPMKGTLRGLIYLFAGRLEASITSLHKLIAVAPEDARAYGYLGDAYFLRDDISTARACYQMAFALGPDLVDLRHVQDREIQKWLKDLQRDERVDGDPLGWFSVIAQIEGLFLPLRMNDLEELRPWLRRYQDLLSKYNSEGDRSLVPRLFYCAMVLSDNASLTGLIKDADLIGIRQKMREWNPDLFALHMSDLRERGPEDKGLFPVRPRE